MKKIAEQFDICVLIPCYNNVAGLVNTLRSIKYHADKLVVLVVDDGSDLRLTKDALFPHLDDKLNIYILNLKKNSGITRALNSGLEWIRTHLSVRYIARLDCADLCHQERFFRQIEFLDFNPEVGLVGTWCSFRNPAANFSYTYSTPTNHDKILKEMHYRNVFIHPTVMFRSDLISKIGYYPDNHQHVEDYAFFWKMAQCTKTAIIPEVLVICEINEKGISIKNRRGQLIGRQKVVSEFGSHLHLKIVGLLKLQLLRLIPYQFILKIKTQIRN